MIVIVENSPELLPRLWSVLSSGGVAIVPCDTMYGIVGAVPESEGRIREAKGREEDKPFLQLVPDAAWIGRVSDFVVPATLARYWPGPLTMVLPRRGEGTIGLRVPDSPFLRELIRGLNRPLYSTSVNRTGQPPLWRIAEIRAAFSKYADVIVNAGNLPPRSPSTIVDLASRPWRVIREGACRIDPRDLL